MIYKHDGRQAQVMMNRVISRVAVVFYYLLCDDVTMRLSSIFHSTHWSIGVATCEMHSLLCSKLPKISTYRALKNLFFYID